jgi:hypothetical protein
LFAKIDQLYAHWIASIASILSASSEFSVTLHVYTDNAIFNHHVFETTFHTFGILVHRFVTCDFMFVQFRIIHHVISSDVTILGVGTIYHGVFMNTQLYVQSILGVTVIIAAFTAAIPPDKGARGLYARSHSNRLSISNSFLLFATENIYSLSVNGSVGTSDRFLDRFEITVDQKVH